MPFCVLIELKCVGLQEIERIRRCRRCNKSNEPRFARSKLTRISFVEHRRIIQLIADPSRMVRGVRDHHPPFARLIATYAVTNRSLAQVQGLPLSHKS